MKRDQQPTETLGEMPKTAAETLHLERLLQTKDMAWLRILKDAQAKEQCRQL